MSEPSLSTGVPVSSSSRSGGDDALPVVIIGAGLGGLTVALNLAEQGQKVVVLAKRDLGEAATAWAQGGIVGVLGSDDSVESHVRDTQEAGAGLVDEHTARYIAQNSAQAIEWLLAQGVPFSPDPSGPLGLHLTREGGHAVRRIAHAADATGKAIHDVLLAEVKRHPNIQLREKWMAIDLITTNTTSFFRESEHFDFLTGHILPVSQFFAYLEVGEATKYNFDMPDSALWTLYERLRAEGAQLSMRNTELNCQCRECQQCWTHSQFLRCPKRPTPLWLRAKLERCR